MSKPDKTLTCACGRMSYRVADGTKSVTCCLCINERLSKKNRASVETEDGEPLASAKKEIEQGEPKKKKSEKCPSCGGPSSRGRGWKHTETCPLSTVNKLAAAKAARKAK